MQSNRIFLVAALLGLACVPVWAQKGGKPPKCVNLAGKITLVDSGMQIRSDGNGPYVDGQDLAIVTLFSCPGESGDAVINLLTGGTTRMIVRDFSARIPVSPQDDVKPSWLLSQPVQTSKGGFNIRHILKGYDPAAGYAPGYPVARCWDLGGFIGGTCEFTTTATSNFTASDGTAGFLRIQNLNPDLPDGMYPDIQALLNEEYSLALIRVRYTRASDPRLDKWEAEPVAQGISGPAYGKFVASMYDTGRKGAIIRLGYFDMNFRAIIERKDGQ